MTNASESVKSKNTTPIMDMPMMLPPILRMKDKLKKFITKDRLKKSIAYLKTNPTNFTTCLEVNTVDLAGSKSRRGRAAI